VPSQADIVSTLIEVTAPSAEPVTTAEVKAFLRVDGSDEDTLIAALAVAARDAVEADTGRSLITTTWDYTLDRWPTARRVAVPRVPLVSVTSITTYDVDNAATTFGAADYRADTAHGVIALDDGASWPTDLRAVAGIVIRYVAGYGAAGSDVPQGLRMAILRRAAYDFEHRASADGRDAVEAAYLEQIAPYRERGVA